MHKKTIIMFSHMSPLYFYSCLENDVFQQTFRHLFCGTWISHDCGPVMVSILARGSQAKISMETTSKSRMQ